MHQDYTAIALLLFTAVPLAVVAATAFFLHQKQRTKNTTQGRGFLSLVARTKPNHLNAVTDPAPRPTSQFWKTASTAAAFVRTP